MTEQMVMDMAMEVMMRLYVVVGLGVLGWAITQRRNR